VEEQDFAVYAVTIMLMKLIECSIDRSCYTRGFESVTVSNNDVAYRFVLKSDHL
jgi:hypothetical protein